MSLALLPPPTQAAPLGLGGAAGRCAGWRCARTTRSLPCRTLSVPSKPSPARAHSPRERSALKSTAPRQGEAPPGGGAIVRPAPREAATGRSAQSCTGRAGTKRLTSLWLGSPTLLCILSFPVCAPGRPCENAKGRRTQSEPPLGSRVQPGTRHLKPQAAPPVPLPGSACFPAVTVSPTSCQAWRLVLPVCPGVYPGHVQLRLGSRDFGAPVPRFRACQSVNPP